MKITYIHQYFSVHSGGTRSYEFAKHLSEKGHEVTIVTGTDAKADHGCGFTVKSTKTKYKNSFSFVQRIMAFLHFMLKSIWIGLREKNSDLVFATSTPLTVGVTGLFIAKVKRQKFVFEVRDVWPDIPIQLGFIKSKLVILLLKRLEHVIYKHADFIIVLSTGMKENLLGKGVPEEKLKVITNLANNQLTDRIVADREEMEAKYPELTGKFLCIHPGTMGFVNGLDFILELAVRFPDPDILYVLIGEGKEKEKLKSVKETLHLDNVLIWDNMPKEDVLKLVKYSGLGIMTVTGFKILEDNSANKFFDFLAAGKPILLNYEGWQKRLLEQHGAGKGFPYGSYEESFQFIKAMQSNETMQKKYGERAKQLAVHSFDSKKLANELLGVFEDVVKEDFMNEEAV
ncbi:glycosyltransferase family 4 protein [Fictibacillus sp. KU28468]|uniref:glycosyltransferase family 4 protein n=1 Tax=Fictibacillus sp. KU28468 TaxID=2991053 RepID=UPI00223CC2FF|nr:glycosyltransferase family 4 protein [Fictibacillus sp. KU28468]UZJ79545.1 glycosyltransferase family 4 protein [Fictibacillus sp. KU28468]